MSVLLETTLGDVVIDLDTDRSPLLCKNFLKLCKARYYTQTLFYNVQPFRFCQLGDPRGDGTGGCSIYGLIDATMNGTMRKVENNSKRFIKLAENVSHMELTKGERKKKGIVTVIPEMGGVPGIIGSQFLITLGEGEEMALDGISVPALYLGVVAEDYQDVLGAINALYCDKDGRPYTDVRVKRALIIHDPFEDPDGMTELLTRSGVIPENGNQGQLRCSSPDYVKPPEERVEERIAADEVLDEADGVALAEKEEDLEKKEASSRAVVLEMLGDLPDADIAPPENVLFVCKLNPVTSDEDLDLIFSRFDPNAKAEVIRDPDNGDSLCYAFVEFTTKEQCNEAYFKMNNVLVDDRRIKVDFSQSVAKEWNRYTQKKRGSRGRGHSHQIMQSNYAPRSFSSPSQHLPKDTGQLPHARARWGPASSSGATSNANGHQKASEADRPDYEGAEMRGRHYNRSEQHETTVEGRSREHGRESRRTHTRRYSDGSRSGSREKDRSGRHSRRHHYSSSSRSSSPKRRKKSRPESSHDRHRRHNHRDDTDHHHKHRRRDDKDSHKDSDKRQRKKHAHRSH